MLDVTARKPSVTLTYPRPLWGQVTPTTDARYGLFKADAFFDGARVHLGTFIGRDDACRAIIECHKEG
jgi:hypothetical protein